LNAVGRYDIELTRYNVDGKMFPTIPRSENKFTKRMTVCFQARANATFTCDFLFKIYPQGDIKYERRTISEGTHWTAYTIPFHLDHRMSYTFRIYNGEVSFAPSEMQIRDVVIIDESF